MIKVLVTGPNGDTGGKAVDELLKKGFEVRALVRKDDERAQRLRDKGVEVVFGDLSSLRDVRLALKDIHSAYFSYPIEQPGFVEISVIFAKAAQENNLKLIVNMSHKQARFNSRSKSTQDHWLSEHIFEWSGIPVIHLRVTMFAEWLLYISSQIRYGRYMLPFIKDGVIAPLAARDTAKIIAGLIEKPDAYVGKALQLHGPVEYTQEALAAEVGRVLGRDLVYERVTVSTFLETFGLQDLPIMRKHFEAMGIDQEENLLSGKDTIGTEIIGGPLTTVEEFINENRAAFELHYPIA